MARHGAEVDRRAEWDALRRATSAGRGPTRRRRHGACTTSRCSRRDVERTIDFYQDLLEFPLTELFENRDYQGSTHFFFDIGNGNLLAFFDFPGPRPRRLRRGARRPAPPRHLGRARRAGSTSRPSSTPPASSTTT